MMMRHIDNRRTSEKIVGTLTIVAYAHATMVFLLKGIGLLDISWALVVPVTILWPLAWFGISVVTSYISYLRDQIEEK